MALFRLTIPIIIAVGIFVIPSIIHSAHWVLDQYTIAPNPSFEEGTILPNNWTPVNGTSCNDSTATPYAEKVWENGIALTGNRSISLKNINWAGQPYGSPGDFKPIPGSWLSSNIPINTPSIEHAITVRAKLDPASRNLAAVTWICIFYKDGTSSYSISFPSIPPTDNSWGRGGYIQLPPNSGISKIRVGLSAVCFSRGPCSGNIWLDDVIFKPKNDRIVIHAFEDSNINDIQNTNEQNLANWEAKLFEGFECTGPASIFGTDSGGNMEMRSLLVGDYSASVTPKSGWINTGTPCQYFTLQAGEYRIVNFGFTKAPTFPYFSQKTQPWGPLEYDHAESIGPFFCGTTIAGCGCAITSSAMLLKYYGVNTSPNEQPTDPLSLNNWLKANNGYAFGALKWPSIAAFTKAANQIYGTQKLQFMGTGAADDFTALNAELAADRPTILQEPGHFIVATKQQGTTYAIRDPAWENKTTLEAYGDHFLGMRRFTKTDSDFSALQISAPAPTELFLVDQQGHRLGKDPITGQIYSEIENAYYTLEPVFSDQTQGNPALPDPSLGVNTLVILTPDQKNFTLETFAQTPTYSIEFSGYDEDGDITVQDFDQTGADQYDIEYSENGNNFEFFQTVEIDARHAAKSNPFNPNARILPLSILASGDFDPQTIDINTIETDSNWNLLNASTILIGPRLQNEKSLLLLLENNGNYEEEICIRGKTLSGEPFRGCDAITIVGNSP